MAQLKNTTVSGSLRATDTISGDLAQFRQLKIPSIAGGTTYNVGNNQVLMGTANGVYWKSLDKADVGLTNAVTAVTWNSNNKKITCTASSTVDVVQFVAGDNVTLTGTSSQLTIAATDTTYSSKTAVQNGTDVSLVTTGEKYIWNTALHYRGNLQTLPEATNANTYSNYNSGDVIIIPGGKEYVYNKGVNAANSSWIELGDESSCIVYKNSNSDPVGSTTQPVYITATGQATACTYSLNATVPTEAVFTDTKNTAGSTNNTNKLYLIGATSQAANSQTYSHQYTYVTNGTLSTNIFSLNTEGTEKVQLQWDTTLNALKCVFV